MQSLNRFMTISAILLGFAQLLFLANFFLSLFLGKRADANPWGANTLEWQAPSPPPHGNFALPPVVVRGPYEYGGDGPQDHQPQTASA